MADRISKETRSRNMRAIKSVSKLENNVAKELWKRGVRFRRNVKDLKGKPDISNKKYKYVIFIDSCFWHVCPIHGNMPNTNQEYWVKKLSRNQERDKEVNQYYIENDWALLRVWEHEFKENFDKAIGDIISFINKKKTTAYPFNVKISLQINRKE
ncbi:very short patch repair endonuclease [Neobacillus drentensis]|uniref:very short patch repair endonuclease n=1 Tax=Neobacillus drentensis TaxID=220684 RepID=UPI002FFEB998